MTPPPKQFTGDDPLVDPLNRMLKNQVENTPLDSEDIVWERTLKGAKPKLRKRSESIGSEANRFRFVRQYKDYTVAKLWTVDLASDIRGIRGSAGAEVRIAKTDETKTSNWDYIARGGLLVGSVGGYRYQHSEPDGSERIAILEDGSTFGASTVTWQEEIFPRYIVNESLILAMKVKQGSLMRVVEAGQTYTVDYIELPGRVFLPKNKKIQTCVEGSAGAWFTLIRMSDAFREV